MVAGLAQPAAAELRLTAGAAEREAQLLAVQADHPHHLALQPDAGRHEPAVTNECVLALQQLQQERWRHAFGHRFRIEDGHPPSRGPRRFCLPSTVLRFPAQLSHHFVIDRTRPQHHGPANPRPYRRQRGAAHPSKTTHTRSEAQPASASVPYRPRSPAGSTIATRNPRTSQGSLRLPRNPRSSVCAWRFAYHSANCPVGIPSPGSSCSTPRSS